MQLSGSKARGNSNYAEAGRGVHRLPTAHLFSSRGTLNLLPREGRDLVGYEVNQGRLCRHALQSTRGDTQLTLEQSGEI
jgi:hypothetical protein